MARVNIPDPGHATSGKEEDDLHHFDLRRALFAAAVWLALTLPANAAELIPGGSAIGIEAQTAGVLISDVAEVQTEDGSASPAKDAGLRAGDLITGIDGKSVTSQDDFLDALSHSHGRITVTYLRGGGEKRCTVTPVETPDGARQLGLWLRDGVSGIGTVTYYDPGDDTFGALGHGVSDEASGVLLPISEGTVHDAQISGVTPGEKGEAGALQGVFDVNAPVGTVTENSVFGIFGTCGAACSGATVETATDDEAALGPAVIRSTVSGGTTQDYAVTLKRIFREDDCTRFLIEVTDPALLDVTGGIVQGMSGSPILQNGKLIGAVTHVLLDDPTCGYGVSIDTMLQAAKQAA